MKKILFVHHGKGIGGAPISLFYTAKGISSEFTPEVLFIHEGKIIKRFEDAGISCKVDTGILDLSHTEVSNYSIFSPMLWLRLLYQPISLLKFYLFCMGNDAKIVHLNTSSLITLAIAAKLAGKKVVMHVREPLASGTIGIRKAILKFLINMFTDAIIPISEYDASKLIPSEKIKVVHNFVDFEIFDKNKKYTKYSHLKKNGPIILHLGGISTLKGTHVLVKALGLVKRKIKRFTCIIVGEDKDRTGVLKNQIYADIRSKNLAANVKILSPVLDPEELIGIANVVVFPSTKPHFARPIIEASAMAKPVIASDLGGPRELIVDKKTGFLVFPNSPEELAKAIIKLLTHRKLALAIGKNGYGLALKKFELKKNVAEIKKVYKTLLD